MASNTGLRQASRLAQINKSYFAPSRTRQYSQSTASHTLLSSRTASFSRHPRTRNQHVLQQSRNLSWWGSGASTQASTPSQPATPSPNLDISEPSDLQTIIEPGRSFKASPNVSSAELEAHVPSTHSPIEPKFIEDAQRAIAEPHFSNPVSLPTNIEEIPERMGYLKEVCGLDFGWGPTSTMQYALEYLHITSGLTWTASILLLGFAVRAVVFPALIGSAKQQQKMRDVKDVLAPLKNEYEEAKIKGDTVRQGQAAQRIMAVQKEFGVSLWKGFLPPLLQIPLGFGCWRLLRNAAEVPVPGFITESWLWTTDLTFSDPYYIAPVISAGLIWATMKLNRRVNNANPTTEGLMTLILTFLPPITFVFMTFQPGAVQLYFIASSTAGLISAAILQRPAVRAFFDMPPVNPVASSKIPFVQQITSQAKALEKSGAAAASKAPVVSSLTTNQPAPAGGLHRRRRADRIAAAQTTLESSEQQVSSIDKSIGRFKKVGKDVSGAFSTIGESVTGALKSTKRRGANSDAEAYEAKIRKQLDEQRRARNERTMGGGR